MAFKPYMTSRDLINAVKRKIMFPISNNTFSETDLLAFANEEMMISQVPSILLYHEEYFVFKKLTDLVNNTSRYPIPDRAIGMRLRDLNWVDSSGNLFEMTRLNSDDKALFQKSIGTNQNIAMYYLEGNEVVLTPSITNSSPQGALSFFFFLRPNQLVDDTRAAIIQSFIKDIAVDASSISVGDTLDVGYNTATQDPSEFTITASSNAITSNSVATSTVITGVAHGQELGSTFPVYITEVGGSSPTINGNHIATAITSTTFSIPVNVTVSGSGGFFALENEFSIGSTDIQTATNLANTLTQYCDLTASSGGSSTVTITYDDITLEVTASNINGLDANEDIVTIQFDQLPTTWTDPITNVTEPLYDNGVLVDFLQTNPGHRTYNYDIELVSASGTRGTFNKTDLQYYASTGSGQTLVYLPILVKDYICLAHECIIPQIPPDLHTGLAERTAARILAAIGDQVGLDRANAKIAEIEQRQGNLLDTRVDGAPLKITNRHGMIRSFKRFRRNSY